MTTGGPDPAEPAEGGEGGAAGESAGVLGPAGGKGRRLRRPTPTVIQMEAVECGAAALAMVLGYYGRFVPLEELRIACGVSRDGAKASSVVAAARSYGLIAKGFQMEAEMLAEVRKPVIIYWAFQHFLVLEGIRKRFGKTMVAVNDPGTGPRQIDWAEFDAGFTGIVLTFTPGPQFRTGGHRTGVAEALLTRRQPSGRALPLVLIASLLLVVPGVFIPVFSKLFIDDILTGPSTGYLVPLLLAMIMTAVVMCGLTAVQRHYMLRIETRTALVSGARFFRHLLRLPVEFLMNRQPAEVASRVASNDMVAEILSRDLAITVVNLVLVVFYAVLLVRYDVLLAAIGVTMALLNVAVLRWVARARTDAVQALRADRGKLGGTTFNTIRLIETIKATGAEPDAFARWAGFLAKVVTTRQRLGVPTAIVTVVPPLIAMANTGLILLVGGLRVAGGVLSLGILVAFQSLLGSLTGPVAQLTNLGERLQDIAADLTRLSDVEKYPVDRSFTTAHRDICSRLTGALEFKDVSFGYSPLAEPVVRDVSFVVTPGRRIALVGGSGSGKSTLGKLAAGMHVPRSGQILLDDIPREEIPREVIAASVSYVDQDICLFEDTVRNNLALWDDSVSDDAVTQALRDAALFDAISLRPGGIYSMVDEGGRNFSGGQRQRLEIARALVSAPTLLILDEATSALDADTERWVIDSLRRRGCACLIMAHRLSTVREADEIIVLHDGVPVERGRHQDLLALGGHYAELVSPGKTVAVAAA
jgi:NHLM bacteriocin system ABC transporter peptidase/ATP-binding protein